MTDTGSNPFAEPDFSAFHSSGGEDATDEAYSDEDVEDAEDEPKTTTSSTRARSSTTSTKLP